VENIILAAIGGLYFKLNLEESMAILVVRSIIDPFCIEAITCKASFSPASRNTTLKT
jgi:hypothetical protein